MQYNLMHRGALIKTFDSNEMDYDELNELKRISGRFFTIERAVPSQLDPMPEGYSQLASIESERVAWGSRGYYRTGVCNATYLR